MQWTRVGYNFECRFNPPKPSSKSLASDTDLFKDLLLAFKPQSPGLLISLRAECDFCAAVIRRKSRYLDGLEIFVATTDPPNDEICSLPT